MTFASSLARAVSGAVCIPALLAALSGCALFDRPRVDPIPVRIHGDVARADRVYVLLPGRGDDLDSFETRGFLKVARSALDGREQAAFVAVDAHLGYYRHAEIFRRVKDQVLDRYVNGKPVTGVGISLGGMGVLSTARRHPRLFERIVLLAPFLGSEAEISRFADGTKPPPSQDREIEVHAIWQWLSDGADGIPISVLYGANDGSREAYAYLARRAPGIEFRRIDGRHDWRTWNVLWGQWLAGR
jgi:pimeloyl-ACP methyl ester carboxylesterase